MATNRDLLKEAIADAKAVKEMAIANAKAALEESFTPQLKSMLSAKLNEMEDLEEDDLPVTEMDYEKEEEAELEEDLDLESLLNELNENEEEETEETEEESEETEESEEEGEPLDLENMTDEDLKKMIEDVIADMMGSGELEMEKPEEEMPEEDEVNLDELLAEIASLEEDDYEESESEYQELEEDWGSFMKAIEGGYDWANTTGMNTQDMVAAGSVVVGLLASVFGPGAAKSVMNLFKKSKEAADKGDKETAEKLAKAGEAKLQTAINAIKPSTGSSKESSEELEEAYATIESLRKDLNEVNLLNAKLLYTNKIFKAKNLTESQKVNVLGMFDKATNVGEVKLVFETLSEGLKAKPTAIKENLGSASKTLGTTNTKQPIVESNDMVARFQKLAGIIKD